jgi:hypothetical protein
MTTLRHQSVAPTDLEAANGAPLRDRRAVAGSDQRVTDPYRESVIEAVGGARMTSEPGRTKRPWVLQPAESPLDELHRVGAARERLRTARPRELT